MAWKDEIQEEANKVANASWASTLRDSMYTSLTKLANFYETILVELTPKIEEKAEAKTLEILGGANSESVAAEVVLARNEFQTLDMRLDYNDVEVATLKTKVNSVRRDKIFDGVITAKQGAVVVGSPTLPSGVTNLSFYDEFVVTVNITGISGSTGRKTFIIDQHSTYTMFADGKAFDVQILAGTPGEIVARWQAAVTGATGYEIRKVIGVKY